MIAQPPRTGNPTLDSWLRQLTSTLNQIPWMSFCSGDPSTSGLTASAGAIAVNIASTGSRLWVNTSGTTSSWSAIGYT